MPPHSKQKSSRGTNASKSSNAINDPRFSNIQTDPRFRLPSRNTTHVKLDKRFSHMLQDDDFSNKASVDRYGRRIPKGEGKRELQKLYDVEEDEDDEEIDDDEDVRKELARVEQNYDPARQGGFSESSSDEDDESDLSEEDEEELLDFADETGNGELGGEEEEIPMGEVSSRIAIVNMDWDNIRAVDLMVVATSFAPPDGRILKVTVHTSEFGRERMEREDLEGPPPELFGSKKSSGGDAQPEVDDDSEVDEDSEAEEDSDERIKSNILAKSTANTAEVEPHALRAYQISRMRYYYGVISCDSTHTASTLYNAMDGREYLSSANFFDMRFIPDTVTFDDPVTDKPRDECTSIPDGYKPKDFVTEALTHSKVRLTWDEDDPSRKEVQKRAFSRQEVDENDLKAYVGSDSEDEEEDLEEKAVNGEGSKTSTSTKDKATSARDKLRAALGLPVDSAPLSRSAGKKTKVKPNTPAGGMQITFTAGLSSKSEPTSVFENKPEDVKEETTRERYIRKEKERKVRRKAKAKAIRDGVPFEEGDDSDVDAPKNEAPKKESAPTTAEEDDPFNDPFFTDPAAANAAAKKASKAAKRLASAEEAAATETRKQREKAELELLMVGEDGEGLGGGKGFDMAEIRKAEKEEGKRGKKNKRSKMQKAKEARGAAEKEVGGGDDFEIDVKDPRFSGVFESHEFAIDPSNPRFSGTKGMKKLLEQGRKRRGGEEDGARTAEKKGVMGQTEGKRKAGGEADDLEVLVEKVKRRKAG